MFVYTRLYTVVIAFLYLKKVFPQKIMKTQQKGYFIVFFFFFLPIGVFLLFSFDNSPNNDNVE